MNHQLLSVRELYFDDPRFRMSIAGRLLVRVAGYTSYLVATVGTATFLISELPGLRALGILGALFLVDCAFHRNEADHRLVKSHDGRRQTAVSGATRCNVASYMSPSAFATLERAYDRSVMTRSPFLLELAAQLLHTKEVQEGLMRLDVDSDEFRYKVREFISDASVNVPPRNRDEVRGVLSELAVRAFERADMAGHEQVDVGDLFAALVATRDSSITRLIIAFGMSTSDVERALMMSAAARRIKGRRAAVTRGGFLFGSGRAARHRVMNRAWTARPTPTLDAISRDYTDLARNGQIGLMVGHDTEYRRMADVLSRPSKPNALLIGEAGAGKETIVEHLAWNLVHDRVPPALFDKRLVALDLSLLVAGASELMIQERFKRIVYEILAAGNVILYIPEVHNLVRTSGTAYLSAADAILPILMNDAFPVIGTTYPREYKQFIEPRSDFAGVFEKIRVEEVSETEAETLLVYEGAALERTSGVMVTVRAIRAAVSLSKKYLRDRMLPGSASELLKDAAALTLRRDEKRVGKEEVIAVLEEKVRVPVHEATTLERETLLNLESLIHNSLIDQEEAVGVVADALREYRTGLARKGGPIAAFLFVGPTGVGKTELSKILARIMFGAESRMLRFDMSEYQEAMSIRRLIGVPDGSTGGALTDAVRENPYSVILLDEFEKAHPDILRLFLQVFDEGRLTDAIGRTIDFTSTILIATSNAHSDFIHNAVKKGMRMASIAEYLKARLVDVFTPELLNRFSRIVVFNELSAKDVEKIATLNLAELTATLLNEQGVTLTFDPAAVSLVARLGYDPAYGARPLRRVIDERLRAPLAEKILAQEVVRGSRVTVAVDAASANFTFEMKS